MPYQTYPYKTLNPWWSPLPGTAYYHLKGSKKVGFSRLARENPGLFNIYWALQRLPTPDKIETYQISAPKWQLCGTIAAQNVAGARLGDTTLVLPLIPFIEWLKTQQLDDWTSTLPAYEFLQELQKVANSSRSSATLTTVHQPHFPPTKRK